MRKLIFRVSEPRSKYKPWYHVNFPQKKIKKNHHTYVILLSVGLILLDQILKLASVNIWQEKILLGKFFGWQPFANTGAAFGLPVPMIIITAISILIIALFIFLLIREKFQANHLTVFTSLTLATAGALSNLIDRIFYGHTVDYILIFTGIINLADCLIIVGIAGFIYFSKQTTRCHPRESGDPEI